MPSSVVAGRGFLNDSFPRTFYGPPVRDSYPPPSELSVGPSFLHFWLCKMLNLVGVTAIAALAATSAVDYSLAPADPAAVVCARSINPVVPPHRPHASPCLSGTRVGVDNRGCQLHGRQAQPSSLVGDVLLCALVCVASALASRRSSPTTAWLASRCWARR